MFFNLNAEMGRAKLTIKKLSEITAINYESLKLKLRGVTEFKLSEMMAIKRKAFPDKTYRGNCKLCNEDSNCRWKKLYGRNILFQDCRSDRRNRK